MLPNAAVLAAFLAAAVMATPAPGSDSLTVAKIAETHPGLTVVKVDIDVNGELADEFGVQSIPSLLLFKAGACVERLVGKVPYIAIERALARHEPG